MITEIQNDAGLRNRYIERTDALTKTKALSLLPDGEHMTISMVADYYEVSKDTIEKTIKRNFDEISADGYRIIQNEELEKFNTDNLSVLRLRNKKFGVRILNRRSLLKIGMLLRDSEVAIKVQEYLLNLEGLSTEEQKTEAVAFTGEWTEEEIIQLRNIYTDGINNEKEMNEIIKSIASKVNKGFSKVYQKLSKVNKEFGSVDNYCKANNIVFLNEDSKKHLENNAVLASNDTSNKEEVSLNLLLNTIAENTDMKLKIRDLENDLKNKNHLLEENIKIINQKDKRIKKLLGEKAINDKDFKELQLLNAKIDKIMRRKSLVISETNESDINDRGIKFTTDKNLLVSVK